MARGACMGVSKTSAVAKESSRAQEHSSGRDGHIFIVRGRRWYAMRRDVPGKCAIRLVNPTPKMESTPRPNLSSSVAINSRPRSGLSYQKRVSPSCQYGHTNTVISA